MPATRTQKGLIGGKVQRNAAAMNRELRVELRRSEKLP